MKQRYTPPQRKDSTVTSIAMDQDVRQWIEQNIPSGARSDFLNQLARDYIVREQELIKRGKIAKESK